MSRNWNRFNEEKRIELRAVLEKVFLDWYADPKINWNELYTIYSVFFILRIRLPLDFCGVIEKQPQFILDIANAYNNYFFMEERNEDEERNKNKEGEKSPEIAIQLLSEGLYWNRLERKLEFKEIDHLIYKNIKSELKKKVYCSYSSLAFAKIAPEKLSREEWGLLTNHWAKEKEEEFIFEVFDFLQLNIQSYFEEHKKNPGIMRWIEDEKKGGNIFKRYVRDRFSAYQKIRSHFSMTDERFTPLVKDKVNNSEKISIGDWVFYCQTLPYHLDTSAAKQKVLHPLTEYEFVMLLERIANKTFARKLIRNTQNKIIYKGIIKRSNNIVPILLYRYRSLLFHLTMTPEKWGEFRTGSAEKISAQVTEVETKELVKTLFSLLTNRPWHTHVRKTFSMYKWNDLQSYFEMTYYPSTAVSSLFVNHLNIHQSFYSKLYNMPLEELPYRDIYTKEKSKDILPWMKTYLEKQKGNQVYKNDNRKLELLEINIDQLRS